jgi:hypothetical protein
VKGVAGVNVAAMLGWAATLVGYSNGLVGPGHYSE